MKRVALIVAGAVMAYVAALIVLEIDDGRRWRQWRESELATGRTTRFATRQLCDARRPVRTP